MAQCAEPILWARPTGNTGNTKNTGVSTRKRVGHVQWKFQSTWRSGLLAGRAHCTEPILWAREYGLIRTYTDYGHMVQCGPCAVEFPGRMAVREPKPCPYSSVFVCISPYYTAPTMCFVQSVLPAKKIPYTFFAGYGILCDGQILTGIWGAYRREP